MELPELVDWIFKMAIFFLVWRAILQDRIEAQSKPKSLNSTAVTQKELRE